MYSPVGKCNMIVVGRRVVCILSVTVALIGWVTQWLASVEPVPVLIKICSAILQKGTEMTAKMIRYIRF